MKPLKTIIFCCLPFLFLAQQKEIDSLLKEVPGKHDTVKVMLLSSVANSYQFYSIEKALMYADSAHALALKTNYKKGVAFCFQNYAAIYTTSGKYDLAIKYILKAIPLNKELKRTRTLANCYNTLGNIYIGTNDTNRAYQNYLESYIISGAHNFQDMKIISGIGLANVNILKKNYKESYKYISPSIEYFKKLNKKEYLASCYAVMADANLGLKNYKEAKKNLNEAITIFKELDMKYGIGISLLNLGKIEEITGNRNEAISLFTQALKINTERNALDNIRENALELAKLYEKNGDLKPAIDNYKLYMQYNDSVFTIQKAKVSSELETKYETKEKENALKLKNTELEATETKLKSKNYLIIFFIIASIIFLVFLFLLLKQINKNKKANSLLKTQNKEIKIQKDIIENKNKDITDSINYAKHIQQAIVPSSQMFKNFVSQSFVIYKPKDIVSGDFYFIEKCNDLIYIAVVDCTGHGVPGAMLSVFIHSNLNSIIKSNLFPNNPAQILKELCLTLKNNLHQGSKKQINDGADMALCVINKQTQQLTFVGAKLNLLKVENNTLEVIKGNRTAITSNVNFNEFDFTNCIINYTKNSKFYLNTDGFSDQFGGKTDETSKLTGKKFRQGKLNELIINYNNLPMHEQADNLLNDFYEWKGKFEQTDDVTMLGFMI